MKKIIFTVVALLIAAPAMASVDISVADGPGPNDITISFDASSETNLVRAFALEVVINDPCMEVAAVSCVNADYYVYPGSIAIDASGTVTGWGSCKCDGSYAGTPDEPNHITLEMGSLYVGAPNAPATSGDLVIITLTGCDDGDAGANVDISVNVIRGGVVMEDPDEVVTVNSPGGAISPALLPCVVDCYTGPQPANWVTLGKPGDWCCDYQALGDLDGNGNCNIWDLFSFRPAYNKAYPNSGYNCAADLNHSLGVDIWDLFIFRPNYNVTFEASYDCPTKGDCVPIP